MIDLQANDRVTPSPLLPAFDLSDQPATVGMTPTHDVPAAGSVTPTKSLPATDLDGGQWNRDTQQDPAPVEITPQDGGLSTTDARRPDAAIPTSTDHNGSGHEVADAQMTGAGSTPKPSATNGHRPDETQSTSAVPSASEQGVDAQRTGRSASDAHDPDADLDRLHALLGHYARQLWDLQKERIGAGNRVAAMERDGLGAFAEPARHVVGEYAAIEKAIDRELTKLAKQHFMADWIAKQRGIGLPGFARLLGVTGDISRFATVSKLWKYLGLHVVNGHAPRREKGVPWTHTNCQGGHLLTCKPDCATDHHPNCTPDGIGTAYAPQGRVICHQIGEAIVKVGGDGQYRRAYDEKKAYYEAGRPEWTQARRHNAAMRYAVKELVKHLWIEWHTRRGQGTGDTQISCAALPTASTDGAS